MADYYSQAVIQQPIPISDMTPLERLVLQEMLQSDVIDDALYFYHEDGPRDLIWLARADLEAALRAAPQTRSAKTDILVDLIADTLLKASPDMADIEMADIEIDLSAISWERILQPIIKRSATLSYLTIVTSWTCSKMRADGFGGMAVMVTANSIKFMSTAQILEKWIGRFEQASSVIKPADAATPIGSVP